MYLINEENNFNEKAKCKWCDATIGLAHNVRDLVCIKCFKRLRSEDIPIHDIIGRSEVRPEIT